MKPRSGPVVRGQAGFGQGEGLRVNEVEGRGPVIQDAAHVAERRGFRTDQVTVCLPPLAPCEPSPRNSSKPCPPIWSAFAPDGRLLQLPIGEIKLVRSFILNPETDEASQALVEAALEAGLTQLPCKYSYEFVLPETASLSGRDESAALNPNSWYTQNLAILVLLFVPSTVQNATVEMKKPPMIIRQILTAFCATVAVFASAGAAAHGPGDIVKPNFEQAIPNLPGKSLVAVEVEYPPGAGSLPHVHAKSAFIYAYVVSGAVESKVNDGDVRVYRAGESWSEPPGASHPVSRNASKTQPAKLLAIFVVDSNDKELTTPLK